MKKLCIFDMDGTTADTLTTISHFANASLNRFGFPSLEKELYKNMVGNGSAKLVHRMCERVGADSETETKIFADYNKTYDNDFLYLTTPYPGIVSMLDALNAAGVKIAIVSNKPDSTTKKISETLFGDRVILAYGGRPDVPLKPDPTAVNAVVEALGTEKADCLYIGDSNVDIYTGKNAGIETVGVLWGFRTRTELVNAGADHLAQNPEDILIYAGVVEV